MTVKLELASVVVCLGLAAGMLSCENKSRAARADEAVPVALATAQLLDVPREIATFGMVEASSTVDVAAQVQGLVTEVHFKEGDFVKRGDLLFTVDTRPYRASLAAAQAELARNKAVSEQAQLEAARAQRLKLEGVASEQEVAKALADAASSAANVQFTRITSPIDGRTGSLLVYPGNVVRPGDAQPLVVIRSLSPVYVRFAVSQDYLPVLRERFGHEPLTARVTPRGEGAKTVEGPVTFLENSVDAATGTIALKASFGNTGQELWPGGSVDVVLVLGVDKQATVVPEAALQRTQSGAIVFVVGKDGTAELRPVQVSRSTATQALIRSGVKAGEEVVTDGQLRLRQGTKITRRPPAAAPGASSAVEAKRPEGL
jgi:multidrug efflux system membrane fusion protein